MLVPSRKRRSISCWYFNLFFTALDSFSGNPQGILTRARDRSDCSRGDSPRNAFRKLPESKGMCIEPARFLDDPWGGLAALRSGELAMVPKPFHVRLSTSLCSGLVAGRSTTSSLLGQLTCACISILPGFSCLTVTVFALVGRTGTLALAAAGRTNRFRFSSFSARRFFLNAEALICLCTAGGK